MYALMSRALSMAEFIEHDTAYDCIYPAAAEQLGCTLLTADAKFSRKIAKTVWAEWLESWQ